MTARNRSRAVADELRAFALSLPEAREEFPWGERVIKVRKKVFVFLGMPDAPGVTLSVKLPESGDVALSLPHTEPTGYGLGRAGWVSARFPPEETPPPSLLREWILESYRAVAPAKLAATVAPSSEPAPRKPPRRRPPP